MLGILSHQSKTQSKQYTLLGGKPKIATLVKKNRHSLERDIFEVTS